MKFQTLLVISLYLFTLTLSYGEDENPLEKSEALITELKFYDALIALEPLLMTDEKSEDQEKALWLANMLCDSLARILSDEYGKARRNRDILRGDSPLKWEKIAALNQIGAGFTYFEMAGDYLYRYAFLKRLLEFYPNSSWRPAAEYYLIQEGFPIPRDANKTLKSLNAYVKKYAKNGLTEVNMAYLDIAHINHGLWAFLAHPDDDPFGMTEFTSGDPEKDKERAAACRAEALKYYAKFIVSGYQGKYPGQQAGALASYKELKQNKASGYGFLVID